MRSKYDKLVKKSQKALTENDDEIQTSIDSGFTLIVGSIELVVLVSISAKICLHYKEFLRINRHWSK